MSVPYSGTDVPKSRIELRVSVSDLPRLDVLSASDPFVVVYTWPLRPQANDSWFELGRTETIKDASNATFTKAFLMDYYFEEVQKIKFEVYDSDASGVKDLSRHDFVGECITTVANIVASRGQAQSLALTRPGAGNRRGFLTAIAEEVGESRQRLALRLRGVKLDKKDLFGKSDPYLVVSRQSPAGGYTVVHKTEIIKNTLNPAWKTFSLSMQALCGNDPHRQLKFEVFDWDRVGQHDVIGEFITTVDQLSAGREFDLINPAKQSKSKYKNSGVIAVDVCVLESQHSFLDYIAGGCELNFIVAVDFTASNGPVTNPQSLHYLAPGTWPDNQYARAIWAVGQVIGPYDTDKWFLSFGFGAKLPGATEASHLFALNGNPENPHCAGVRGVLDAYAQAIQRVTLWGPTNFAPVIRHTIDIARTGGQEQKYLVLLIITDGAITDMHATKAAISEAANLPISIIIVGVGGADFTSMEELDGDDVRLTSSCSRDIVQFVPYRDFQHQPPERLAAAVLEEVPDQLTGYFKSHGVKPNPRPPAAPMTPYLAPVGADSHNDAKTAGSC